MVFISALLFLIASFILWRANKRQKSIGLPAGRIIYSDVRNWRGVEQPLYDRIAGLTGRPDYLIEQKHQIIPVEVKSRRVSTGPFDSHIFQIAAYCLLVHRHFSRRPEYGVIHYANRTYAIDFTPEIEAALLDLIQDMHSKDRRKEVPRSHNLSTRCTHFNFRTDCNQKLM